MVYTVKAIVEIEFDVEAPDENSAYRVASGHIDDAIAGNNIEYFVERIEVFDE